MRITILILRYLLALQFLMAGIEKLFLPFNQAAFIATQSKEGEFVPFYLLLQHSGYLLFVGVLQLICAILLLFRRTYLLGAVMLLPIMLCLVATHVFITHNAGRILYDLVLLAMNVVLILHQYRLLKPVFLSTKTEKV